MSINQSAIKLLYGRSAGRCNICEVVLVEHEVQLGEMAHIIAKSPGGPRYDDRQADLNSYDNLILLCAHHHTEIDKNPSMYPPEKLRELKKNFEAKISASLRMNQEHNADKHTLETLFTCIPFSKLLHAAMELPENFSDRLGSFHCYDNFAPQNPQYIPFNDKVLGKKFSKLIELMRSLHDVKIARINVGSIEPLPVTSQAELEVYTSKDTGGMVLNYEELSNEQINSITKKVSKMRDDFIQCYNDLMAYIRANFEDIKFDS